VNDTLIALSGSPSLHDRTVTRISPAPASRPSRVSSDDDALARA
jgi:hypothetical protein